MSDTLYSRPEYQLEHRDRELLQVILLLPREHAAALASGFIKGDDPFLRERDVQGMQIQGIQILSPRGSEELVYGFKRKLLSDPLEHLCSLLSKYRQNLYYVENRIAQHGPLDVPIKLINEKGQLEADIQEVEREILELAGPPDKVCQ